MSKVIGFMGSHPADICLYAALALQNTGKSVCVIDHSEDGVLYHCIPTPDDRLAVIHYHGIDFRRREPLVRWQDMDYEFVFVQLGAQPQELCLALCSKIVLIVDCERANLDFYSRFMQESKMMMMVLLRGFCPMGISVKRIKGYFAKGSGFIEKWMTLPLDEADEAYRISMQYEIIRKFAHMSAGMEKALIQLLHQLEVCGRMELLRAVKAAKNGRMAALPQAIYKGSDIENQSFSGAFEYGG